MRYTPRSSVTAAKVLPVASRTAVTVTPGSTPPVESVTVPVNVASCAYAVTGSSRIPVDRSSPPTILNVMTLLIRLTRLHTRGAKRTIDCDVDESIRQGYERRTL